MANGRGRRAHYQRQRDARYYAKRCFKCNRDYRETPMTGISFQFGKARRGAGVAVCLECLLGSEVLKHPLIAGIQDRMDEHARQKEAKAKPAPEPKPTIQPEPTPEPEITTPEPTAEATSVEPAAEEPTQEEEGTPEPAAPEEKNKESKKKKK